MFSSHNRRLGLSTGALTMLALLAACNDPGVLAPSEPAGNPLFVIAPPGPGQTYWDFVDLNTAPGPFGGRVTYNNVRNVNNGALGSVKLTATLQAGLPPGDLPQVVFQWFAQEDVVNDEKGVGICRRSGNPNDQPSPCYTGGEIGESSETKDLWLDLAGLAPGVELVSVRISSLQDGERFKLAFCTGPAEASCGADVNGLGAGQQGLEDVPAPVGTKFVRFKPGNPGLGANDYLVGGMTTKGPPPPPPPPPPVGGQGCSPGYWKNHNNWPAPYTKNTQFSAVFENAFPGKTLQQVLSAGGGGLTALGRQTVSALLNAKKLGANYELTPASVISKFNAVFPGGNYETLKNQFEALTDVNGRRCPLN